MKIILLPGLDGTGDLFEALIKSFPEKVDIKIISLDSLKNLSYPNQAKEIADIIDNNEVFLVGESYSGRIAYEIYQILGNKVKGIVFLASFISRPSFISIFSGNIPISLLKSNLLTKKLLRLVGFNSANNHDLANLVFDSLEKAAKHKLKSRLKNIANLDKPNAMINCPVIYIRPKNDLLVSCHAVRYLESRCSNFTKKLVDGGHFIAQSNPEACAEIIYESITM